jgi:hypothetical protein
VMSLMEVPKSKPRVVDNFMKGSWKGCYFPSLHVDHTTGRNHLH